MTLTLTTDPGVKVFVDGLNAKAPAIWLYKGLPDEIVLFTVAPLASTICVIPNTPIVAFAVVVHESGADPSPGKYAGDVLAFGALTEKLNENVLTAVPLNVPEAVPEVTE